MPKLTSIFAMTAFQKGYQHPESIPDVHCNGTEVTCPTPLKTPQLATQKGTRF